MLTFNSYRFSLLVSSQRSLFDSRSKEEIFNDLFIELSKTKKEVFTHFGNKNFLYLHSTLADAIFLLQLAKEETFQKPIEGSEELLEVSDTRSPFIYVIIDLKRQILLIQEKQHVIKMDSAVKRLEDHWIEKLASSLVDVSIKPINDTKDFWEELQDAEQIEEFDITLNAPNLFRGRFEASKFVKAVHDEYNISDFTIKLRNKLGKLSVVKDNIKEFINLASAGAGEFALHIVEKGVKKTIKSIKWVVKKIYHIDRIEDLNIDQLENDLNELDRLSESDADQKQDP